MIIMLRGLPASGKSTYAKDQVTKQKNTVRVNKDDLRDMLHAGQWSQTNEKMVIKARDAIIATALTDKQTVIVDDTNFAPSHEETLRRLAEKYGAGFMVLDFHEDLDTCIYRDAKRERPVGAKVIQRMWDQYVKPAPPEKCDGPNAILVDMDGTLAHITGRTPFEDSDVSQDVLCGPVADVLNKFSDHTVIVMSGRDDGRSRESTSKWLAANCIEFDHLFMRPAGDVRADNIIKRELYEEHIRDRFNINFVLDDRNSVVSMWRELGLTCFQVAPGFF